MRFYNNTRIKGPLQKAAATVGVGVGQHFYFSSRARLLPVKLWSQLTAPSHCPFQIRSSSAAPRQVELGNTRARPFLPSLVSSDVQGSLCPGFFLSVVLHTEDAIQSFFPFHPYPQRCRPALWFEALPNSVLSSTSQRTGHRINVLEMLGVIIIMTIRS